MRSVYIAGSRRFFNDINFFAGILKENNIEVRIPKKGLSDRSFEKEKEALFRALKLIDSCGVFYVFSKGGYIGKTVAMEIAYAYAKGREIIAMEKIEERSAQALISKIMGKEELIGYCK
ncbi:hypothetical protein HZB00_00680 [Candidatus Woesearchaeota archaeon]|nr:hypothetical protein [Candidatus Woesearchaeota archaeon]